MSKIIPQIPQNSLDKSTLLDFLDEGRLTEWLASNGKNILYGLAAILSLLVIIFAFSNRQNSQAEQEYLQATKDFNYFSKTSDTQNPALVNEAFERLKGLLAKHPELHAAYDGQLAQILLNRGQVPEAKPYATSTLNRVKSNDLPFYRDFAETTLLISQQDFKQSLDNARALQNKMNEMIALPSAERSFGDELFALNLLRIAMLQQETGDQTGELQTWNEWKQYAGLSINQASGANVNPQAFRSVIQHLAIGSVSLPDYISHRENLLKK